MIVFLNILDFIIPSLFTCIQEWLEFVDSAGPEGVILFSMGGYASGMDGDVRTMFAESFAQLPQRVIWKLNGEPPANVSRNVKLANWIPQNDLLGKIYNSITNVKSVIFYFNASPPTIKSFLTVILDETSK